MIRKLTYFHLFFFLLTTLFAAEPAVDLTEKDHSNIGLDAYEFEELVVEQCTPTSTPFCISQDTVTLGSSVCLSLMAQNYADVLAFQFGLTFDTAVLSFDSIVIAGTLSGLDEPDFFLDDANQGFLSVAYFSDDGETSYSMDDGTELVQFCFTAQAEGQTDLAFSGDITPLFVANGDLEEVLFDSGDGQVTVIPCMDVETQIDTTICAGQSIIIGSIEYAAAGVYNSTLMTVDGCDSLITLNLTVAEVAYTVPEVMEVCQGETATVSVPDGFNIGLTTPISQAIVLAPGSHTVIVEDIALACQEAQMITIEELALPDLDITGDLAFCAGSETTLTVTGAATYMWSTGETTESIIVAEAGVYSVTGTDANGCASEVNVTVEELVLPDLNITGDLAFCAGSETTLTVTGAATYMWSTGETTESIIVAEAGVYSVTGTDANGCASEANVTVEELALPDLNITGDLAFCAGSETTLTVTGATTYMWSTGETTESIIVSEAGVYSVTGTDANGCASEANVTVEELALPDLNITGDLAFCAGSETTLTVTGAATYMWSTGETTESIIVSEAGVYSVTGTDANGCASEANVTVEELALPDLNITGDLAFCAGSETTLTVTGATTYMWSTGETTELIIVSEAGVYSVTGTDANGCASEANVTVEELALPDLNVTGDLAFCAGSETTLTVTGAATYMWSTGETTESIIVSEAGVYSVTGTDANGCASEANVTVEELALPDLDITGDLAFCAGSETTLTVTGAAIYMWSTGETTESIIVAEAGVYSVTGTDANGCASEANVTVEELALPDLDITGDLAFCAGSETTLTVTGAATYMWSTGETTESIIVSEAGVYSVTGTDANGCASEANVTVEELALPDLNITGDLAFCAGSETTLTVTGAATYMWSTGETTESIIVAEAGVYSVTGTDANGCQTSQEIEVTLNPLPMIAFQGETMVCGDELTLITASGGTTYMWSGGENPNDAANLLGQGTYTLTVTDANGCENTADITITGDTTAPDIVYCPADILVYINAGETGTEVTWPDPLVEDDCNDFSLSSTHISGDLFNLGTTTVSYTATDASENSTSCSFDVRIEESAPLTFYVDTLNYSASNDTFLVPIAVIDFDEVVAFQYTITAPNLELSQILGIESTGVLNTGGTLGGILAEQVDANTIQIIWVNESGQGITLPDSTAIFHLVLQITAPYGSCVPLEFSDNPLEIEAFQEPVGGVRPTVRDGEVCIDNIVDIVGEIYRTDDMPINRVEVSLLGDEVNMADTTDLAGRYFFIEQMGGQDYSITPSRDFEASEGLTVIDLVMMTRHINGINLIEDPYLLIAADINNNANIAISDILEAREVILNNIQNFPFNSSWRFIPTTYTFPEPTNPWLEVFPESETLVDIQNDTIVDFYGVKIGDLNLSASTQFAPDETLNLIIDDQDLQSGQSFNVAIAVEDINDLAGAQWALSFDTENLDLLEVKAARNARADEFNHLAYKYTARNNELAFVWLNDGSLKSDKKETIVELQFTAKQAGRLSDFLKLENTNFSSEAVTNDMLPMNVELDFNSLEELVSTQQAYLQLASIAPNPFANETNISLSLQTADNLHMEVFDATGKLVYVQDKYFSKGTHSWQLNASQLRESGVYLIKIQGATSVITATLIKK